MRSAARPWLLVTAATAVLLASAGLAPATAAGAEPIGLEPSISAITPESGESSGGTAVVIKGEHLLPGAEETCVAKACEEVHVKFGGEAASVQSGTPTELHVTTPAHAAGPVEVAVTTVLTGLIEMTGSFEFFWYVHAPPQVTITSPSPGSVMTGSDVLVTGEIGVESWLEHNVSVTLYQGASEGSFVERRTIPVMMGSHWSSTFGPLAPGTYALKAEQQQAPGERGSAGRSPLVVFTVTGGRSPGDPPPIASFSWLPSSPKTGEAVSLISSSKDSVSPITSFGWSLASTGPFQSAGPVYTTTFATTGAHTVRLRVGSADGQTSIVSETITVADPPAVLMEPFPIVRITGTDTESGVKLSLLSVLAPSGAEISVQCKGRGCPVRRGHKVTPSSPHGSATVRFRKFERALPAGVKLVVRVTKQGEIGKYTRFAIRKGKLPKRTDTCLEPSGVNPQACP